MERNICSFVVLVVMASCFRNYHSEGLFFIMLPILLIKMTYAVSGVMIAKENVPYNTVRHRNVLFSAKNLILCDYNDDAPKYEKWKQKPRFPFRHF